jgi:uncharacterized phosphosugar-binding protein
MKPVPVSANAYAFEKRSLLITVKNEDFSFHQKSRTTAKIIFSNFAEITDHNNPDEIEVDANDPGWFSSYE